MRFLSNCILVQAHTRMIQRRERLPVPTSLLSHAKHTRRGTMTRAQTSRRYHVRTPFSVSMWLAE